MITPAGDASPRYVRVLLVEDDEEDAMLAREMLAEAEHLRFAVTWARDAEQALHLCASERYDVCLLDVRLGKADGLEVLSELRARRWAEPIVMLTGQGDRELDLRALEAGATDYLVKGKIDAALLERTIRYAMANHAQREAIADHARQLELSNRALRDARAMLQHTNEQLAATVQRQNELLGMAAHDLRSPLGIVLGYASFLADGLGELPVEEQRDLIARIQSSVRFMVGVIDDLLDIAAIESGTLTLDTAPCALGELVERVVDAHRVLASPKRIRIRFDGGAAQIPVVLDPRRFEQVVHNLVGNATKYSHPGGEVRVRVERNARHARLVVEDDGIGIPAVFRERLFSPFAKAQRAGTSGEKSVGLGLAITRRIVDAHGGTIAVESEAGRGARFVVEVPLGR